MHPYSKHKGSERRNGKALYKACGGSVKMASGGTIKPLPISAADSPGGMGFPPRPDDSGARMASARTSGSRAIVEKEIGSRK